LIPGLTRPLITISASMQFMGQNVDLFTQTRSILQSIRSLHESGNDFVAGLILLFSVVVPFVKGVLLLVVLLLRKVWARAELFYFVRSISKWAMADVFVVGVYVAYLAAKATDNLDAQIRVGFYWFVSYCLVSLLALQFMKIDTSGRESAPSKGRRRWAPWWWVGPRAKMRTNAGNG
jgi:uncharacterized paraquat-inducible protein A